MTSKNFILSVLKIIGILVGLFLLLLLFYKLSTIIVYVLLAIVFSLIANPVVLFLKTKLKFKNTLAVIATLLLFLLLIVGFVLLGNQSMCYDGSQCRYCLNYFLDRDYPFILLVWFVAFCVYGFENDVGLWNVWFHQWTID